MRTLRSVIIIVVALAPIVYVGRLLYYFLDLSGSVQEAESDGLGPTLLGLGLVGLLFCIALAVKLIRIFGGPRSPGSVGRSSPPSPSTPDGDGGFDADAVLARYMAKQTRETVPVSPAVPPARQGARPARSTFGRKSG
jgi:hypothetical protein